MKKLTEYLTAVVLLCAVAARAQVVQCTPTNATVEILVENNLGKWASSWHKESVDQIQLGERVLTFRHVVYFARGMFGSRFGGPKMLEDTYRYRQIGAAAYTAIGGEKVTYFAPLAKGVGWIASTNIVSAVDMEPLIYWLPGFVGTSTIGDSLTHTTTTGSPIQCWGKNIGAGPYLLRVPCTTDMEDMRFYFRWRFEKDQRQLITLSLPKAQDIFEDNGIFHTDLRFFCVDFDDQEDQAL